MKETNLKLAVTRPFNPARLCINRKPTNSSHLSISDADVNGLADGSGHSSAKKKWNFLSQKKLLCDLFVWTLALLNCWLVLRSYHPKRSQWVKLRAATASNIDCLYCFIILEPSCGHKHKYVEWWIQHGLISPILAGCTGWILAFLPAYFPCLHLERRKTAHHPRRNLRQTAWGIPRAP